MEATKNLQGDEEVLETLLAYLKSVFPRLEFGLKEPLKDLFPEPESRYLQSFWQNNSHADITVRRHGHLVCIVEPGGFAHFKDEKQKIRDKKKDKICELGKVNVLRVGNEILKHLGKPVTKKLFKKFFYGKFF